MDKDPIIERTGEDIPSETPDVDEAEVLEEDELDTEDEDESTE